MSPPPPNRGSKDPSPKVSSDSVERRVMRCGDMPASSHFVRRPETLFRVRRNSLSDPTTNLEPAPSGRLVPSPTNQWSHQDCPAYNNQGGWRTQSKLFKSLFLVLFINLFNIAKHCLELFHAYCRLS
ncbi:hypothetical protein AVEN_220138-1 [Araneus ventricosus]|uniref:Uncharacterized protein n=1 Tax=Araneus ventricosus TaxID=182803 RepID=A0A4Y2V8R7_ARAVE|nr:hypothetical protein AVEN_220138-1 [Araneus ventricosus]